MYPVKAIIALVLGVLLHVAGMVWQTNPATAKSPEAVQSIDEMLDVFDKSCVDVFVRRQDGSSIDAAFRNVGLTLANASYRLDPDRPVSGYLAEDYAANGMICAIAFAGTPEQEVAIISMLRSYAHGLPGEVEDKKPSSTPSAGSSDCPPPTAERQPLVGVPGAGSSDQCDIGDHLIRHHLGTRYYVELARSATFGPEYYVFKLTFDLPG